MGQRCETRLEWQGYAGVNDEVCQDIQDQYTGVSTEFSAKKAAFEDTARAVDATRGIHKIRADTSAGISGSLSIRAENVKVWVFTSTRHYVCLCRCA
jgi:hypothetical protein